MVARWFAAMRNRLILSALLTTLLAGVALLGAGFAIVGLLATLFLVRTSDSRAHVELDKGAPATTD